MSPSISDYWGRAPYRYAGAILGVVAASLLRAALGEQLQDTAWALTLVSVVIIAWLFGVGPCLVAQVLTLVISGIWFPEEPDPSDPTTGFELLVGLGGYFFIGLTVAVLGQAQRAASRNMHAERDRFLATLTSIGDAVIATDAAGRVTFVNSVAESLTGWKAEEANGRPLTEVFHIVNEHTREPADNPCDKALRSGRIVGLANHTLLISRDGTERPVDDSASPIFDNRGTVVGVVLVFRDATEPRAAHEALQKLAALVQNSHDAIIGKTMEGIITSWNAGAEHLYGYSAQEAIGKHISFVIPPDRRAEFDEAMQRLKRGERIDHWDTIRVRKDGSLIDVSLQVSPITNRYGEIVGASKVARNISDRKRGESTLAFLADISATLAALVDPASALQQAAGAMVPFFADWCVVYLINSDGRIEKRAYVHRDPEAQIVLEQLLERFPIDWSSAGVSTEALRLKTTQFMAEISDAWLGQVVRDPEHLRLIRQLHPRSLISVPLQIRGRAVGTITFGACASSRSYTERDARLAEDLARRVATAIDNAHLLNSLKAADRQKDDFLAMLAHELRNPLAAIQYATDAARLPDVEVKDELLEMIDRQVKTLARLIDDLLDISRISRNKIQLRRETIDLSTIVRRAVVTIRPLVESKNHELVLRLADDPLLVDVDSTRMEQVFCNLLTNSAKYTPDGGRITLAMARDGDDALVTVQDTGIGISSDILPHVFDLFAQADKSLDRSQGGLGIGLTVVRKLAEMHGGTVTAYSAGVGQGAEFTVRLPLSATGEQEPAEDVPGECPGAAPLRILVVDDSRDTSRLEAALLRRHGHQVEVAYDGLAAMTVADQFRPHAILLDIGLPGLNGYEVAARLRQSGSTASLIAVSGYGQFGDRQRSRTAGFDHHLVKPVNSRELLEILGRITPGE